MTDLEILQRGKALLLAVDDGVDVVEDLVVGGLEIRVEVQVFVEVIAIAAFETVNL